MGKKPRPSKRPLANPSSSAEEVVKPKDTSPRVYQRDKISFDFSIRELPWTEKQKELIALLLDKDTKCVFIEGPAGSSKTCTAVYAALQLLRKKRVSDITYIRSAVESADSKIGYLPGDIDEKFGAYIAPLVEKLEEFLESNTIKRLHTDERVGAEPVNYVRGRHWAAKVIIVDECQNLTYKELVTLITRLGEFSKIIFLGDPYQSDLPWSKAGGFTRIGSLFKNEQSQTKGVHHFKFTKEDIVRSEFVKFVVGKLEEDEERRKRDKEASFVEPRLNTALLLEGQESWIPGASTK